MSEHLAQFHDLPEGVDGSPAKILVTCTGCGWTDTTDPDPGAAGQAHKAHVDSLPVPEMSDADVERVARKVAELRGPWPDSGEGPDITQAPQQ